MTASVVSNSCRLTVIAAGSRVDLAVPTSLAVADLLALVVSSLGGDAADLGLAEGGWVLQRVGEEPLDAGSTLGACRVLDGDVLYLRTRAARLPELCFDDVVDAVATGVATRTSRWLPQHTVRAGGGFACVCLALALVMLALVGPPWPVPSITAAAIAVALIGTAAALARRPELRGPALSAAGFAITFAWFGGASAVAGDRGVHDFGAGQLLAGVGAGAVVAAAALLAVRAGVAAFVAVIVGSALTAVGAGLAAGTPLPAAAAAAVVAAVALVISPLLPTLAFRLSRLPLPDTSDRLDVDDADLDAPLVLRQAVRADQCLTGLVGGVAVAVAGAAAVLSGRGPSENALAVVLALICLLRARLFFGSAQRAMLLAAGGLALAAAAVAGALATHGSARILLVAAPAAALAVALFALTTTLPNRRYAPPWSRAADVLESLLVLSVLPLALGVVGVYGAVRTLNQG